MGGNQVKDVPGAETTAELRQQPQRVCLPAASPEGAVGEDCGWRGEWRRQCQLTRGLYTLSASVNFIYREVTGSV